MSKPKISIIMVCYNNLYSAISDVNYKVSESEKCILDGLKKLVKVMMIG